MATVESLVYARLSAFAGLTALVSTRIYPAGKTPQPVTIPYVTYQRIDGFRVRHLGGPSGLAQPIIQVNSFSNVSPEAVRAIADQVRYALDGYASGAIKASTHQGDRDLPPDMTTTPPILGLAADYRVTHTEATS